MSTNKSVTVPRNSLIAIVAIAALIVAQNVLAAAHLVVPVPLMPGNGGVAAVSGRHASDSREPASRDSARPIINRYLKIQNALAQDSLQDVAENAAAIAKAARNDTSKMFPRRLAQEAVRLAEAKDLAAARHAFHRVSPHLMAYVKKNHLAGFYLGYCRMQKMPWLQSRFDRGQSLHGHGHASLRLVQRVEGLANKQEMVP